MVDERALKVVLCVIAVTAYSVGTVAAQPAIQPFHAEAYQENAPPTPGAMPRPRVDLAAGFTIVKIRAVPPCEDFECRKSPPNVGGALSFFASAGYFWTPHLITQVEIVSQAERYDWDYADERVVSGSDGAGTTITLKHNYQGSRRSVAQIVQFGRTFKPFFGVGVGIESQTTYDSWYRGSVVGPNLKTVNDFPSELPRTKADYTLVFGAAGFKAFMGSHAYLLLDGKFTNHAAVFVRFGFGVELP